MNCTLCDTETRATHAMRYSNRTSYYCAEHFAAMEKVIEDFEDDGPVKEPEVVNGKVYYRTKNEVNAAIWNSMRQGQFFVFPMDADDDNPQLEIYDGNGHIISHEGNILDDLPEGRPIAVAPLSEAHVDRLIEQKLKERVN